MNQEIGSVIVALAFIALVWIAFRHGEDEQ